MEKKCLKCGKLHDGNYGSGKYCNVKCANSRVRSEEVKKKISEGVKKSKSWEKINRETFDKEKQIKSLKETWRKKRPKWDEVHISTKKRWLKEDIGDSIPNFVNSKAFVLSLLLYQGFIIAGGYFPDGNSQINKDKYFMIWDHYNQRVLQPYGEG